MLVHIILTNSQESLYEGCSMQYTAQTAAKGWLSTSSIVAHHPHVIREKKTGEGLVFYFQQQSLKKFC